MALIRAPRMRDGAEVAVLWRELWDLHTGWGGYAGSTEPAVYTQVAARLDNDFRHRQEQAIEGAHIHLVAIEDTRIVGQVEGWLERYGDRSDTYTTCEIRSLIVSQGCRGAGVGRQLLETLGRVSIAESESPVVMVAEVLSKNPALAFYQRAGFTIGSYSRKLSSSPSPALFARPAGAADAFAVGLLGEHLAQERRARGDLRFDPPAALDAARVSAIATYLRQQSSSTIDHIVFAPDGTGIGIATLSTTSLDPPFVPQSRAALGRFALADSLHGQKAFSALAASAWQDAQTHGATFVELTELTEGPTPTLSYAIELGAEPWSTIVAKTIGT
jgi:GNAT superfamily N-acetyltransferase